MGALYKKNDIASAARAARKMVKAAASFGVTEKEKIIDWLDAERYVYANSRAKEGKMAPEKILDKLLYEIPELRDSTHHIFIENRKYQIAVAAGTGSFADAIALSHESAKTA
ncbi:MAG TPA: hypothetical protein PLO51_05910, partial [Candidatus Micrarchaeota archaeon]|nr:hypothetical protein [Candidatus Micrarchaeota archaeon]